MEHAVLLHLPLIDETKRVPEEQFWNSFDAAFPGILGGLCSALSVALKNRDNVKLTKKPRMADLAMWVTAAEPALGWEPGTFMEAYRANLDAGVEIALDASPLGEALLKYMTTGTNTLWSRTRPNYSMSWSARHMNGR